MPRWDSSALRRAIDASPFSCKELGGMIGVDGKSVRRWRSGERRPKTNEPIRDILNHVGADGETRARVLTALGNTTPEEVVRLLGGEPVNAEAVALPNAAA